MQRASVPRLVFPDTTAIINFALVDEMPLLERLVGANGSWCATVASECDDQARKQGLPQMRDAHRIFGQPLRLQTPSEWVDFRANQTFFRQASRGVDASHAGESEMLAILAGRTIKSLVVSDESGVARRLAVLGMTAIIQSATSWEQFRVALVKGLIAEEWFWTIGGPCRTLGAGALQNCGTRNSASSGSSDRADDRPSGRDRPCELPAIPD